jgi:hypothetical protein
MKMPLRSCRRCALVSLGALLGLWLAACAPGAPPPFDLLRGKTPKLSRGIEHVERLNDGVTPADGDPWLTDLSAVYASAGAQVVYDLGRVTPIDAIFIEADNNDRFSLSVSDDGLTYRELWRVPSTGLPGMQPRLVSGLAAQGRYLRLTAIPGDPLVSVGELMVFARQPEPWPPRVAREFGTQPSLTLQRWLVGFGAALALLLLLASTRFPSWAPAAAAVLAACVAMICARQLADQWPPALELGEVLRAVIAAVGALAVIAWSWPRARVRPSVVKGVLALLGLLGLLSFYNFGRPWFFDAAAGRPTAVHTYDMRVYFPVAKYFDELGFDGVYFASVKAYLVGERLPQGAVANVMLRDLRTNQMVRASAVMSAIDESERRFSPQRFAELVQDMRYFWRTMGPPDYLGSLSDHGGNATPVWLALANLLFRGLPASERTLTCTALLDPLLLLCTFICIGRSFGLRAMLLCVLVFGATDFPMFGSDWAGSTLRFDWMATLGLGCCALKTKRHALGGALLAHAGLVRAFPAVALAFAPVPLLIYILERGWQRRRPTLAQLLGASPGILRMCAGAVAAGLLLVGLSVAMFGFTPAWGGWVKKIELHTEDANTNHVGVRTVTAFDPAFTADALAAAGSAAPWVAWQATQLQTYQRRQPLAWALRVIFTLLCLLACRGARPEQAALLGLLLVPVFTYPANYYLHYVYLLPLLAVGKGVVLGTWLELVLLLMCVAQYFTLALAVDVRFFFESVILLLGFAALLLPLAASALRRSAQVVAAKPGVPSSS